MTVKKARFIKKVISLVLVAVTITICMASACAETLTKSFNSTISTGETGSTLVRTDIVNEEDYTVIAYGMRDSSTITADVIVITEQELMTLGKKTLELLDNAEMLYLVGDMDVENICDVIGASCIVFGDESDENIKIGTAITIDNGEVYFNEVFALFSNNKENTVGIQGNCVEPNISVDCIEDGIHAALTVQKTKLEENSFARMQAPNFYTYKTKSAIIYGDENDRIGTMGYTVYFYKCGIFDSKMVYDCICISTFAPDSGMKCRDMSVTLDSLDQFIETIDATDIKSNSTTVSHTLGLTKMVPSASISWSYSVDAQTVIKEFDMLSNKRTWGFIPKSPKSGDAWIEEPGIRFGSKSPRGICGVNITLAFPYLEGTGLPNNVFKSYQYFIYE